MATPPNLLLAEDVLGLFLYGWARQIGGRTMGLGVAVLYALSPTFLAHGRLVATDIGVVLGAIVAMYLWINFLKRPTSVWRIVGAALGFGFAMLLKFSLVLLIPTFIILTVLAALLFNRERRGREVVKYILLAGLAGVLSLLLVITPFYQAHIVNYPAHRQVRDTIADLQPDGLTLYEQALGVYGADKVLLRPAAQFFRGVLMAAQRVQFGNTVYFLGQVKGTAFWYYFPIIFLVKLPPGVLLLFATGGIGLWLSVWHRMKRSGVGAGLVEWLREHFTLAAMILFGVIYWGVALVGNLNIGIRHVSITIPMFYILAMWGVIYLGRHLVGQRKRQGLKMLLTIAFGWYVISSALAFPHYLSYYNIFGGGTENGYKVAVDSNYDWGQDFYRLVEFIEEENIDHIYLDYFGGEDPEYWLGEKVTRFNPRDFSEAPKGWVAISLNQLMGGIGEPVFEEGLNLEHGYYNWILPHEPVARAGKSILIYNIK